MAGVVRPARRPPGWVAPGPAPRGRGDEPELAPRDDEDLSFLVGDWRIYQKQRGHRWSLDDLVTAFIATQTVATAPRTALDLGCGLGSVLMMVAWRFSTCRVVGIEAQTDRAELGRRSLRFNGADDRCEIIDGDLREPSTLPPDARFELITGTPPYFVEGEGTQSELPHAAPCRFEHRGGVEAYVHAAERWLAPGGTFVLCSAALERARVQPSARLHRREHWEIVPKVGKAALICVDVFGFDPLAQSVERRLTVRDEADQWTAEFQQLRAVMGLPPRLNEPLENAR